MVGFVSLFIVSYFCSILLPLTHAAMTMRDWFFILVLLLLTLCWCTYYVYSVIWNICLDVGINNQVCSGGVFLCIQCLVIASPCMNILGSTVGCYHLRSLFCASMLVSVKYCVYVHDWRRFAICLVLGEVTIRILKTTWDLKKNLNFKIKIKV